MKYSGKVEGVKLDELIGGTYRGAIIRNVKVGAGEIKRGDLLASSEPEGVFKLAASGDEGKYLAVAVEDITADAETVTQAYTEGVFNREKIRVGEGAAISAFEKSLREQNIELTRLLPNWQPAF